MSELQELRREVAKLTTHLQPIAHLAETKVVKSKARIQMEEKESDHQRHMELAVLFSKEQGGTVSEHYARLCKLEATSAGMLAGVFLCGVACGVGAGMFGKSKL